MEEEEGDEREVVPWRLARDKEDPGQREEGAKS